MAIKLIKVEDINYDALKGFEKAAILLNYLGPEAVGKLFKNVDDGDIRKLLALMGKYRIAPVEIRKKVLEEYYEMISESREYIFSENVTSKETVVDAVGEERAR